MSDVIQMVDTLDLIAALDSSVDFYDDWREGFDGKVAQCSPRFVESILTEGIAAPICIQLRLSYDGSLEWILGNGHHRLAIAYLHAMTITEVPVVFSEGDYMLCHITTSDDHPSCRD